MAETEDARSEQLETPEAIYRACADMKLFNQEAGASFCWTGATVAQSSSDSVLSVEIQSSLSLSVLSTS